MPDNILLSPDTRHSTSGPADFAHYGGQPDPIASFSPAQTDSRPIDPLGIAAAAETAGGTPAQADAPVLLDQSLSYPPPAAAPLPLGSSSPVGNYVFDASPVRTAEGSPVDPAASASPIGGGSLAPAQFIPVLDGSQASSSLSNALAPTSLDAAGVGSAFPVAGQLVSNVAALQTPVAAILSGTEDALLTPVASQIVVPLAEDVVAPVVSNVAVPLVDTLADAAAPVAGPVGDVLGATGSALGGVTDAVQPAATGLTEAVTETAAPVTSAAAGAVEAVAPPVTTAAQPIIDTATQAAEPIAQAAAPVTAPVAEAGSTIAGPAVDAGIATLVDLVQAADMIVPPPPGAEPAQPESDAGSIVETLAAPEPEDSLLGTGSGDNGNDDGDNDGPLGFGGI